MDFAYITNPAARAWAEAHPDAVTALTENVGKTVHWHDREALAVICWVAAVGYPGDANAQQREVHFQVMSNMESWGGWSRERSEALDLVLAKHLPLPAPRTEG